MRQVGHTHAHDSTRTTAHGTELSALTCRTAGDDLGRQPERACGPGEAMVDETSVTQRLLLSGSCTAPARSPISISVDEASACPGIHRKCTTGGAPQGAYPGVARRNHQEFVTEPNVHEGGTRGWPLGQSWCGVIAFRSQVADEFPLALATRREMRREGELLGRAQDTGDHASKEEGCGRDEARGGAFSFLLPFFWLRPGALSFGKRAFLVSPLSPADPLAHTHSHGQRVTQHLKVCIY
jgi:hypothetical protein